MRQIEREKGVETKVSRDRRITAAKVGGKTSVLRAWKKERPGRGWGRRENPSG